MTVQIGIDYTSAVHQLAGIGRYTRELVKALAALSPAFLAANYHLFVADASRTAACSLPGPNFTWRPTRLTERWLSRIWFRLYLPLPVESWTGPLDLFHAPDFFLPPVRSKTRSLVTVHDLSFVREPDSIMPGMSYHLNTWVPNSVQRADHVIAVSESTRLDLIELYGTPPEKITVLHHGVAAEFKVIKDEAQLVTVRRKYKLGDRPFILSVGTLQPRKNYRRLIRAFAQVEADVALVIAGGTGWDCDTIFDEVRRQKLEERVYFPGYISDADLPLLYNAAGLFVYPSLYEGFGLPVLEAMACGTPVIAADRSALPEVVGRAGLLVEPKAVDAIAAAINRVLSDSALYQNLSEAGLKQAAKFSWSQMAEQLVGLYQNVIDRKVSLKK